MELPKHPVTTEIPKETPHSGDLQLKEISTNPFKRAFHGLDKLFKYNQTLTIIILVVSLFSSFMQFFPFPHSQPQRTPAPNSMYSPYYSPPTSSTSTSSSGLSGTEAGIAVGVIILIILVIMIFGLVLSTYIQGMVQYVAWKTSREETTTFGEAFSAVTKKFWTILGVEVQSFARILGGTLLLIVPGIRAALRYEMALFPVFDEDLPASQAMNRIKNITKGHLIEIFGVGVAAGIVPFINSILRIGGHVVLYPELKFLHDTKTKGPKVHWLNYLGFILLAFFLVVVVGMVALLASIYNRS